MCDDTVRATVECFERGALTSATIMPKMPATAQAVEYARAHPQFSFGIHLTFVTDTVEAPFSDPAQIPALTGPNGLFLYSQVLRRRALLGRVPVDQVEREMRAQIGFLTDSGVRLSHVDSHGHLHKFAPFVAALRRVLPEFGITRVRNAQDLYLRKPLKSPTYWFGACGDGGSCGTSRPRRTSSCRPIRRTPSGSGRCWTSFPRAMPSRWAGTRDTPNPGATSSDARFKTLPGVPGRRGTT